MKKYKCSNCGNQIDPRNYKCKFCNTIQPLEERARFLERAIADIECKECGFKKSFYSESSYFNMAYCAKCGNETFYDDTGKIKMPIISKTSSVQCPYCKSFNTEKISGISKAVGIATFGVFALPKTSKQWHCKNCKSDF